MGSGETYPLRSSDIIISKEASYALLTWPDQSITRLAPSTRLVIEKMEVTDDYGRIEIEFSIENGKVWTHVVRTMYPGSFFRVKLPT
jgi:hypothetical protein